VSDEGFKFTPGKTPKFPALIMRAFTDADHHAEWILTPPNNGGWFTYNFDAKQDDGTLFIMMGRQIMTPKGPA
jgi:hypothetical protein